MAQYITKKYRTIQHHTTHNITPNQAISDPKKQEHVMHLHIAKAQQNGFITNLNPGDKVRIDDTSLFKKETESRWSVEAHNVRSASEKSVTLTDETIHRRSKVLIVPHNTVIAPNTEKNDIKVATKKHKDKLCFKREGIDKANGTDNEKLRYFSKL